MANLLRRLVEDELSISVDPQVRAMAEAIAARHGEASRAVLFYGSCLRERQLDGLMLDFYLIVSDYEAAYDKRWLAAANRLIPPNVFPFQHGSLAAKYAVLSEKDFHRLSGSETRNVSVWARFAQPSRLVWAKNDKARNKAIDVVASVMFSMARLLPVLAAAGATLVAGVANAQHAGGEAAPDGWRTRPRVPPTDDGKGPTPAAVLGSSPTRARGPGPAPSAARSPPCSRCRPRRGGARRRPWRRGKASPNAPK